jgi:hypothetical protein
VFVGIMPFTLKLAREALNDIENYALLFVSFTSL